jgi:hypothetical protein
VSIIPHHQQLSDDSGNLNFKNRPPSSHLMVHVCTYICFKKEICCLNRSVGTSHVEIQPSSSTVLELGCHVLYGHYVFTAVHVCL